MHVARNRVHYGLEENQQLNSIVLVKKTEGTTKQYKTKNQEQKPGYRKFYQKFCRKKNILNGSNNDKDLEKKNEKTLTKISLHYQNVPLWINKKANQFGIKLLRTSLILADTNSMKRAFSPLIGLLTDKKRAFKPNIKNSQTTSINRFDPLVCCNEKKSSSSKSFAKPTHLQSLKCSNSRQQCISNLERIT